MKIIKIILLSAVYFSSSCDFSGNTNYSSDNWTGEPDSGFRNLKVVEAKNYMVSSGHELASKAGVAMIKSGGNAIDAVIATQLVLNVVEPHSSGIGGGAFILYYDKKSGKTIFFNGRETAPQNVKSTMFLQKDGTPKAFADAVRGGLSVGTPGVLKAMFDAHAKYGKLPWSDLFKPAIKVANEGFVTSDRFNKLTHEISYLKDFDETAKIYLNDDKKPFEKGDIITNKRLAKTFEILAKEGIKPFYEGKIAKDIANSVQTSPNPGYLSFQDLKNYQIKIGDLLCMNYRQSYKVCTMPAPSSGITMLQILGIVENFDLSKFKPNSIEAVNLISEATRLAYADRNQFLGDKSLVDTDKLLDKNYLKKRASLIKIGKRISDISAGDFKENYSQVINQNAFEAPSTTHMSVIDSEGNAVSMTSSIEYFFGSAVAVDGFLLNNQLTDFSFIPTKDGKDVANKIMPLKQPRSSMSPSFVFDKNDNLILIVGSPGGPRIIQFVAKAIINHLDFHLDIQKAISLPTFIALNDVIELEKNQNITKLQKPLEELGYKTKIIEIVSGIQAISIKNNKLYGASDPRREGSSIGL